ncbi:MAG: ABC transporter ATP-binding protein [Spirochaetes bacterium GWD1_27_9]|nr:MAG: ABC transporter ATP-binding protein [Spirochaetes bacterium GWB1_27_13]OHD28317.1 MAG: ABC transporter ATP-binding protein [Spirochaetes bacterium GWC1_27_15]OHD29205.1 MAG: ABC transporter ATP-binding protein [Spirochaetes bacterium GWD1_27_9]
MKCERNRTPKTSCGLCCTKIVDFNVVYGKNHILKDINLHLHCGNLTAIIGPNGAGKTTLLKAILGQVRHTGQLKFVNPEDNNAANPTIGYVPQKLNFDAGTPVSVMDLFSSSLTNFPVWLRHKKKSRETAIESLTKVKAEHLINCKLGDLSGGELQRVLLALALNPIPDILLLDEPVSGIDERGLTLFYKLVSDLRLNYDLTIVLISHDLELVAKYANRIVLLNKEIKAYGNAIEVYNTEEFKEIFGEVWAKALS